MLRHDNGIVSSCNGIAGRGDRLDCVDLLSDRRAMRMKFLLLHLGYSVRKAIHSYAKISAYPSESAYYTE
jgi:hypothetical protein